MKINFFVIYRESAAPTTAKKQMQTMYFQRELQNKRKLLGISNLDGKQEVYYDKDRAAAVTMGDQDIKTSLKVRI